MSVGGESRFSDWTMTVKRNDNSIWEGMKYLGKAVLDASTMHVKQINWLAEKIKAVKKGGNLDGEEFSTAALMLGSKSVTISGCAKELLQNAGAKQPEEARKCLMGVLLNGIGSAKMDAAEVLSRNGDLGAAVAICRIMPEFAACNRRGIARMVERLVRNSEGEADLKGMQKTLKEGASRLQAAGEDAQEEFRKYFLMMRNAARMAESYGRKKSFRKKDPHEHRKRLKAAC